MFNEIEITWKGETYKVTPNMRLIAKIEERVSIMALLAEMTQSRPRFSHMSILYSELLNQVGVKVTEEEVYEAVMNAAMPDGDADFINQMTGVMITGLMPVSALSDGKK